MARVAIVGSCITRDLWPVRGDGVPDLLYVSRTSLPSLFGRPVPGFKPRADRPEGLTRHQHDAVAADLTKTSLRRLAAFRPTHLIIDFIDERFDLMRAGGTLITRSWELEASSYLEGGLPDAEPIARESRTCERLWRDAAAEFAAFVESTPLGSAVPILHAARWATVSRSASGALSPIRDVEVLQGRPADIGVHNDLLDRYETYLASLMPGLIAAGAPELRIADEAHRWGLSPFHYVPEYYEEIWRQLEVHGIPRPPIPVTAAPSAPGA